MQNQHIQLIHEFLNYQLEICYHISEEYYKDDETGSLPVFITGVDTGYFTQYAYSFIDSCNPPMVVGLKGKDKDKFKRMDSNSKIFASTVAMWTLIVCS